jgi:hypothetical protein
MIGIQIEHSTSMMQVKNAQYFSTRANADNLTAGAYFFERETAPAV